MQQRLRERHRLAPSEIIDVTSDIDLGDWGRLLCIAPARLRALIEPEADNRPPADLLSGAPAGRC